MILAACGGSQSGQTTTPSGNTVGSTDEGDAPPPDGSRPEDAVALVRTGPLETVLTAFIPTGFPMTADSVPFEELTGGDAALAARVDRSRGFQLLLGRHDVTAYSVGITGEISDELRAGSRGELETGARWAVHRPADDERGTEAVYCVASPAADGNRLICGGDRDALVRAAPYMARTVAGMRLEGPSVRVEALLDSPTAASLRERLPAKLAEVLAEIEAELNRQETGVLANADVRRELLAFARGALDVVRSVFVDAREADFTVTVREGAYVLETRARYESISSEWFTALMSAFRAPAGWPTDLFARLPPDAVTYSIGTSDSSDISVILNQLKSLTDAVLNATTALPEADRVALRTATDAFFAPEISTVASASNMGTNAWNVVIAHTNEGPSTADRIARLRALRVALARRPVAAAIEALATVSGRPIFMMRDVRDMSAREVPAGGYGIRFKVRAPAPLAVDRAGVTAPCGTPMECGLRELAPAQDQVYELVLAPLGGDFVLLFGKQTRPLWNAIQASTGPGITPGQPALAEAQILPSRLIARVSEQVGERVDVDAGERPIIVRFEPAGEGPGGTLDADISIPTAFINAMVGLAVRGLGAAQATTPAPTP